MGFRTGAYAKVWDVQPTSDTLTKLKLSVRRKNKQTGQYEDDFSGFVQVYGSATAQKAARLKKGDTIKLGDVDVGTKYNKEKGAMYTNFKLFSFSQDERNTHMPAPPAEEIVDDGEVDDSRLPY